ncbi:hypothetical protein J5N97_004584 [Dioscorea zingiberensis]|uniref:Cytochrome b5 heme-binding domain-containing protein n=1 Tax=Dioscorea zingiberensis TaxID=325984 RepID=A0A9D5D8M8_9LILI|nr:hypothetical protein J5N97_004584 [Dioscorea zingiberensis]
MEMVVLISVILLVVASLLLFPRSHNKGKGKSSLSYVAHKTLKFHTKEEVSLHNTRNDCWIIVNDKVYDVTPYVEEHPGGDAILKHAGGDSTKGFYGPQHASRVFDMVDEFYIGDLKS